MNSATTNMMNPACEILTGIPKTMFKNYILNIYIYMKVRDSFDSLYKCYLKHFPLWKIYIYKYIYIYIHTIF
jgi:hypothetical protein